MGVPLAELKGSTEAVLTALKAQGINDSDGLLEKARTRQERETLASSAGVEPERFLKLTKRADMARLKGVGRVYSDLLEEAGVDTVNELAQRPPAVLHARLIEINAKRQLTQRPPSARQIADFVRQAKALPIAIEY